MEFLRNMPTRYDDSDDDSNEHNKKKKRSEDDDDEEEDFFSKRKKKKIAIDFAGSSNLGLNVNDNYFEIDELKRRDIPREDGLEWSTKEKLDKDKRPFGKIYLNDQAERTKILYNDPNYRFIVEIAGALRKEPFQLYEEEDMERVLRERESERMREATEMKRVYVTMDKKYEMVKKLEALQKNMIKERNLLEKSETRTDNELYLTSLYLVDNKEVPNSANTRENKFYGFLDLTKIATTYKEDITHDEMKSSFQLVDDNDDDDEENDDYDGANDKAITPLLFYLKACKHDFLSNDSSLKDSLTHKLNYVKFHQYALIKEYKIIDQCEDVQDEIDNLYKDGSTNPYNPDIDTINLYFLDQMGISDEKHIKMAIKGCKSKYGKDYGYYIKPIIRILYGSPEDRINAMKIINIKGIGTETNGHPPGIVKLIQESGILPDYFLRDLAPTDEDIDKIRELLKAHFMWLFFKKHSWEEIVILLKDDATEIVSNIRNSAFFQSMNKITTEIFSLYVQYLLIYFREILEYFSRFKKGTAVSIPLYARNTFLDDKKNKDILAVFKEWNTFFKQNDENNLVHDKLFLLYLKTGRNSFVSYSNTGSGDGGGVIMPITRTITNSLYPSLILHYLYRSHVKFVREYDSFLDKEMAMITRAIQKATLKIASVVGDEEMTGQDKGLTYKQRKSFTTQPINSGMVRLKAEIHVMIDRAYHTTQLKIPSLKGLPLEGFHCEKAYETGLTSAFAAFVAALSSYNELSFQDSYKTIQQFKFQPKNLADTFSRLSIYGYVKLGKNRFRITTPSMFRSPCHGGGGRQNFIMF